MKNLQRSSSRVIQLYSVVSDNAFKIVKALKDKNIRQFGCYSNCLNLVVKDAFEAFPSLKTLRDLASKIVTLTKQSTQASDKLEESQRALSSKKPKK